MPSLVFRRAESSHLAHTVDWFLIGETATRYERANTRLEARGISKLDSDHASEIRGRTPTGIASGTVLMGKLPGNLPAWVLVIA
jgi:hypothetical protein